VIPNLRSAGHYLALAGAAVVVLVLLVNFSFPAKTHIRSGSAATPRSARASSTIQPIPGPFASPQPVAGHPGEYYVTCYSSDMTPACRSAIRVQVLQPGGTTEDVFHSATFICAAPKCNYKAFDVGMAASGSKPAHSSSP
jgi:hypothetical protein